MAAYHGKIMPLVNSQHHEGTNAAAGQHIHQDTRRPVVEGEIEIAAKGEAYNYAKQQDLYERAHIGLFLILIKVTIMQIIPITEGRNWL
jgi:hypothetical protein